ncbi:hypothetical protein [Bacillus sp. FDAARGOS_1420]|uniref:hypothetical protein n=1 Tax=unclassified Bacillus (in: firmicutes) TaxID=185979 RepID=UPI001C5BB631|nr:hypothetical protein [Bacillus sp. FDAARGOS_1420]MBW3496186.1 hypothetical protein [Bacillus sp. FDAARGOS_1420]
MSKNFIISKQSDLDGFTSFSCSLCGEEFKLQTDEVQKKDVIELFCPSCGIPSPLSTFYTDDIIENAKILAANEVSKMLNDMFKDLKKSTRGNKYVKVKSNSSFPVKKARTLYEKDELDEIEFTCCSRKAKTSILAKSGSSPFCPYCGVN